MEIVKFVEIVGEIPSVGEWTLGEYEKYEPVLVFLLSHAEPLVSSTRYF